MIKLGDTVVPSGDQWEAVIRGCRNPLNSWSKSDSNLSTYAREKELGVSYYCSVEDEYVYCLGPADQKLMLSLAKAGSDHRKFMRMLTVYVDVTAPLYWWKEMDTYKVGTVANSCSTMHKIADKEFTIEDFSCEHLWGNYEVDIPESEMDTDCYIEPDIEDCYSTFLPMDILEITMQMLNKARDLYLETKDKTYWWQMIQLLPSSYNQKRTLMLNYETLANIYRSRKGHKLDEWEDFRKWIETLPFSELIKVAAGESK